MISFVYNYIVWHYSRGLRQLGRTAVNIVQFLWRYFSLPHLVTSLFGPWSRLHEAYAPGIHPVQQAQTFIINTLMRLVGATVRMLVITVGVAVLIATPALFVVAFVGWLLLPAAVWFFVIAAIDQFSNIL